MDPQVFFQVVVPLLTIEHTAVLGISTPEDEQNYYSVLLDMKLPDGSKFFKTIQIGLSCDDCVKKKLQCIHKKNHLPPWKTSLRQEKVEAIMANFPELMAREAKGQIISAKKFEIEPLWIEGLRDREPYQFKNKVDIIHVGIDPSGGSSGADYAITSWARESSDNGMHYAILGSAFTCTTRWDEVLNTLDSHLSTLLMNPLYQHAKFYIYFECQGDWLAGDRYNQHLSNSMGWGSDRVEMVSYDTGPLHRLGVPTSNENKKQYNDVLVQLMSHGMISYAFDFVTNQSPALLMKTKLENQMSQWRSEPIEVQHVERQPIRRIYTAKSSGVRDDSLLSLMIGLYWGSRKITESRFLQECQAYGLRC